MKFKYLCFLLPVLFLSFNLYSQGVKGTPNDIPKSEVKTKPKGKEVFVSPPNHDNFPNQNVNLNYGFTKDGIIYIHKSLIPLKNGDDNLFLCYEYNNWSISDNKMQFNGNYYYYKSEYAKNSEVLVYCFYCSKLKKWMPQYLYNENKDSPLMKKDEIVPNDDHSGHNFKTAKQDYFPGGMP